MKISFDLDDTLICLDPQAPKEANRVPHLLRSFFNDPLGAYLGHQNAFSCPKTLKNISYQEVSYD